MEVALTLKRVEERCEREEQQSRIAKQEGMTKSKKVTARMSTPARKRLMRDFKRLQQDPPAGISGAPHDNNIMFWNAVIFGPDDTPWDGGTFKLTLQFTEDYPNKPPTVRFVSRMFHPNIYADGSICLDILQNQWSPIYDVAAVLTSIQSLLCDPNPNSPANSEAARMFSENKREYNRKLRSGKSNRISRYRIHPDEIVLFTSWLVIGYWLNDMPNRANSNG
ncbi:hypothetical protein OPV22_021924 [Ensete ventricosum]|uniref:E2 ubiquitin-conjugating enzyme n=1 Tax=Ensete ventricosum TaxID=4639 RepID=A0AAV8QI99_ENSVE|nr:hypothetical protein OPV22_021924 [Ensete ventricosum]